MTTYVGLVLASTLLFVSYGDGLRCYTCSSDVNQHCGDPFENDGNLLVQDCSRSRSPSPYSADHAACRKIVKTVNNDKVIIRACSWVHSKDEEHCSKDTLNSRDLVSCDTCETDMCNGSTGLTASVALILSIITAKYLA